MNSPQLLQRLLREWIHEAPATTTLPDGVEPEGFYHAAFHHQLGPWLAEHPIAAALPDTLHRELREDAELQARLRLNHLLGWQRLQQDWPKDAAPIVLKGWAITHDMYPHLSQRNGWDIDLLLCDREAADAAHSQLLKAGWLAAEGSDTPDHHLRPLHPPESQLHVELHHNLGLPLLPEPLLQAMCNASAPYAIGGVTWQRLSTAGRIVHHLLHVGADPTGAPFLRNLAEAAHLIHHADETERAQAWAWAGEADAVGHPVRSLWGLASEWFEVPIPGSAPASRAQRHLSSALGQLPPYPLGWRIRRELTRRLIEATQEGRSPAPLAVATDLTKHFIATRGAPPSTPGPKRPDLRWRRIGEIVVVQGLEGRAHVLNPMAAQLWEAASEDGQRDWKTICADMGVRNIKDMWDAIVLEVEGRSPTNPPPPDA